MCWGRPTKQPECCVDILSALDWQRLVLVAVPLTYIGYSLWTRRKQR
jgi:hypothetical protein